MGLIDNNQPVCYMTPDTTFSRNQLYHFILARNRMMFIEMEAIKIEWSFDLVQSGRVMVWSLVVFITEWSMKLSIEAPGGYLRALLPLSQFINQSAIDDN